MGREFSVIIPTHNRRDQLLLTLTSFEHQNYSREKFEIIVVDDCSDDGTPQLMTEYGPNYQLKYIYLNVRGGQGVARNIGVENAKGKNIIFNDADFLVLPDYLATFADFHAKYHNSVISATPYCFEGIYSHYFSEFTSSEKNAFKSVVENSQYWKRFKNSSNDVVSVITAEDIRNNFSSINELVMNWKVIPEVLEQSFLDTAIAPWLLFITKCVSIEKKIFNDIGGFDPRLIRGEDWECGYRLYRKGLVFKSIEKIIGYHQEHPQKYRNPYFNHPPFYAFLLEKYGLDNPELSLLSLWESSDDLWNNIPVYKNVLRKLREGTPEEKKDELLLYENIILKASKLTAKMRLEKAELKLI